MSLATKVIDVTTPSRSYEVHVGRGLLDGAGKLVREFCGGDVAMVVSDSHVAPLYADRVMASLKAAGYECHLHTFPAGEASKVIGTYAELLEDCAACGLTRDDCLVALGGGVTGDLAGFAAATYLRGVSVAQIPTSLLAMVDSSVGGKTAVDLSAGKNLAGAFFQPSVVIADIDCLSTIDHSLFTDSCGEVIKHGVLADPNLFAHISEHPINAEGYDADDLVRIVARNVEIKRDVVDADERESGVRQTLNLGHTIGHAVEAASNYSWGHGTCVAVGLCCVVRGCAALGVCDPALVEQVEKAVAAHGLPIDTDVDHAVLLEHMRSDKKRHASGTNVVIPIELGRCEVRRMDSEQLVALVDAGCGTCGGRA